jgi:predicted Fe-Mo cluster-binding NifX family protein
MVGIAHPTKIRIKTMSFKVAVASKDGKVVHRHFGHAEQFIIFEIEGEKFMCVDIRPTEPPCHFGQHDDNRLMKSVELISDCKAVLASQIGPGAARALYDKGIKPFTTRDLILDALQELISSGEIEKQ